MLLDDVVSSAVDNRESIAVLLRRCLLLAHDLKNESLKAWANQELNGYCTGAALPEYRIVLADAFGNFSGPFNASLNSWPIPPAALEEEHRGFAEKVYLLQAVSAYEDVTSRKEGGDITFPWPPDLVVYYQRRLHKGGYALINAWQRVDKSCLVQFLDTIRNRTLKMALEIKDELGESITDLRDIGPAETEKIQETIVQNIYGGTNFLASGSSQMSASASVTTTAISVGDRQELNQVLRRSGLHDTDLADLEGAIQADGNQKFGSRVMAWIRSNAPKVVAGGVKIGAALAQQLLTEWLKQYYGIR